MTGVGAREQRAGRARHRHADARLQDAVALDDAPLLGVEARSVERVFDHADQLPRRVARQARVAVEREAVAHATAGSRSRRPAPRSRCRSAPRSSRLNSSILPRLRSQPIQTPSLLVPAPGAMEQEEPVRACRARSGRSAPRSRRSRRPAPRPRPAGSRCAASGKSVSSAKCTCGSMLPSACTSRCSTSALRALDRRQQRGHDDHGARRGRHASAQIHARQRQRLDHPMDDAVQQRHREVAGGHQGQRHHEQPHPWRLLPAAGNGQGHRPRPHR